MYFCIFYLLIVYVQLTYPGICPGNTCMYSTHIVFGPECMRTCFFIGGVCDTLGNSGFSGELMSIEELGQTDLIKLL